MPINAHRTFAGTNARDGYLQALGVTESRLVALRAARDDIRRAIQSHFAQMDAEGRRQFFERRLIEGPLPVAPRPKFRRQGSYAYHTLNARAQIPPQEVDFDDGMFLPVSFVMTASGYSPQVASAGYFRAVEAALTRLCVEKGWRLVTDKTSCVRVEIADDAHVDLALYAMPDTEFETMRANALREGRAQADGSALDDELRLALAVYEDIELDRIKLATRDTGWRDSDPRRIEEWFKQAVDHHGEALRRVCRYLKGWRDQTWEAGGPQSIALMACAVAAFDALDGPLSDDRDDLALKLAAQALPDLLRRSIPNPVLGNQRLDEGWSEDERADFVARAEDLAEALEVACDGTFNKTVALQRLTGAFGSRIPQDEALLSIEAQSAQILEWAPAVVAAPAVPRTTSG